MKLDKKILKEFVDMLDEFKLTELEYQDGDKKIRISKGLGGHFIWIKKPTIIFILL